VVGSQTASLTPDPSFAHNLGCRCPNGQCEAIFDIYASRPFQWHQEHLNARCFGPCYRTLNIWESRRTSNPHFFQVLGFTPTLGQNRVATGNVYIMIMIEHFSKWIKLVALPDKSSHNTSHAFLQQVLNRLRACVKCLTNQGSKFFKKFQDLFDHALINHRRTSRDHPQADGLVKKMVQTLKNGFRNICLTGNKMD
jgi:hypothetical protein